MERFWNNTFSGIYPKKLDMTGMSILKQILAQQLVDNILVDIRTRTETRTLKVVTSLLKKQCEISGMDHSARELKRDAAKVTRDLFQGRYDELPILIKELIIPILPVDVKKCLRYDLKKNPDKYITYAMKLCRLDENGSTCFMPTRRSCIPCHVKFDMEAIAQMLIPYRERVRQRKEASDRVLQ